MLVTEPSERDRLIAIIKAAVEGGVNAVQLRDKTGPQQSLLEIAALLKSSLPGIPVIVNGRPATDEADAFDCIHLPEDAGGPAEVRVAAETKRLVGRSVHSLIGAVQAEKLGTDYLLTGTIFASTTHPDLPPAGLEFLRQICKNANIPVIAIGGVTPENLEDCIQAGAAGIAVLSPIMRASDPYHVARHYRLALESAWAKR